MEEVIKKFDELIKALRETKPNDRSERDRYVAVTITEVEKARALYIVHGKELYD